VIAALIALGILIGVSLLPIGIRASYDSDGALIQLRVGPFFYKVYPSNRTYQKQKRTSNGGSDSDQTKSGKKSGGNLNDIMPMLRVVWDLLKDFKRKLKVQKLEFKLILAGADPCDLSMNYGRAWAALGNIMPVLDNHFNICKRNLEIECDYLADQTTVYLLIDLTMSVGRLLGLAVRHGFRGLLEYRKLLKTRKGGA